MPPQRKKPVKRSVRNHNQKSSRALAASAPTHKSGLEAKGDLLYRVPLFPVSTMRSLFYYDYDLGSSSVAGVPTNYFFCANGMFDPNTTGTGHQPMGFDQMMLMYNQYTVLSSKISVTIYNTTSSVAVRVGVYLTPDATAGTDPSRIVENGLLTTKVLSAINVAGYHKEFSLNCDVASYMGRPKGKTMVNSSTLAGTAAANPTEGVFYNITGWDPFGASNFSLFFDVLIEYKAVFWEPRKLTVS